MPTLTQDIQEATPATSSQPLRLTDTQRAELNDILPSVRGELTKRIKGLYRSQGKHRGYRFEEMVDDALSHAPKAYLECDRSRLRAPLKDFVAIRCILRFMDQLRTEDARTRSSVKLIQKVGKAKERALQATGSAHEGQIIEQLDVAHNGNQKKTAQALAARSVERSLDCVVDEYQERSSRGRCMEILDDHSGDEVEATDGRDQARWIAAKAHRFFDPGVFKNAHVCLDLVVDHYLAVANGEDGVSLVEIGRRHGVCKSMVMGIVNSGLIRQFFVDEVGLSPGPTNLVGAGGVCR